MTNSLQSLSIDGMTLVREGKVRSLYEFPEGNLLIVASDRISAFDVVLPTIIPDKGKVLTQISNYWFNRLSSIPDHHLVETRFENFPENLLPYRANLEGRSVIVRKTEVVPFECVVRGFLSGSLWKAYLKGQTPYGLTLPKGLLESDPFPEPIFTPTTKAHVGHDMPVTEKEMADAIGTELTGKLKKIALEIFIEGSRHARKSGMILADTKFEFGIVNGDLILIDECLTPDSSRFWPLAEYQSGKSQPSYDKQYVRDYLSSLDWDKNYPGPDLPDWVVKATQMKYLEAYRLLTGNDVI